MQTENDAKTILEAALEVLQQGELLLSAIDDETYTRRLAVAYNACIGGHYRHCLDHFRSWLTAGTNGGQEELNYDQRQRDPLIESDRFAALNATHELIEALNVQTTDSLKERIAVRCKASYAATEEQVSESTLGRELVYVVAHAVHHYALIGVMAALQKVRLPDGFGVAPSTVKHQQTVRQ